MSKCLHDEDRGGVLCETPGGNCANCGWNSAVHNTRIKTINQGAGLENIDDLLRLCLTQTMRDRQHPAKVDKKKLAKLLRDGKTAAEISKALGCTPGTARWYRTQFKRGVPVMQETLSACNPKLIGIRKMYADGMNCAEIGAEVGYTEHHVREIVRQRGFKRKAMVTHGTDETRRVAQNRGV